MAHDPERFLHDVLDGCRFLGDFVRDKTIDDFRLDRGFRSAVERELQIIGEAITQLDQLDPRLAEQIPECRKIIAFRHILVHGYRQLDPETVWSVVSTKLEGLGATVAALLRECDRS